MCSVTHNMVKKDIRVSLLKINLFSFYYKKKNIHTIKNKIFSIDRICFIVLVYVFWIAIEFSFWAISTSILLIYLKNLTVPIL